MLQKTLINVRKLNVYIFLGIPGVLAQFWEISEILIRKWWDFACSSAPRDFCKTVFLNSVPSFVCRNVGVRLVDK